MPMKKNVPGQPSFACSLLAGGIAGTTVDVALFPLDTIKTRMQAPTGFRNAGGFRGVYSGLSSAAAGSAPTAALFFTTYEVVKAKLAEFTPGSTDVDQAVSSHIAAASLAEAGACLVRVPTENVKQKLQVGYFTHTGACIRGIIASDGARGFFRGYWATIAREVPFSGIQFPIYERLKLLRAKQKGCAINSVDAALCGSIAGAIAGLVTCPLDVAKTRLMLGVDGSGAPLAARGVLRTMLEIHRTEGAKGLMRGATPRVLWMSAGGLVFLGCYEHAKSALCAVV